MVFESDPLLSYCCVERLLQDLGVLVSAFLSFQIHSPSFRTVVVPVFFLFKSLVFHCLVSLYKQYVPLVYPFQRLLFQSVLYDSSLIPSQSSTWISFYLALVFLLPFVLLRFDLITPTTI
ncbi:BgTH12-06984 [Blumeria graminis f. sp. triticale]|uniref:Bgt-20150-3 n=3 Tax=Blumeria graminis TaxID=34373 RepID=A0A9X9MNU3_BLUGR|nr:BgTH12-06984 [Blumeria graminis f. sp. triticale]VDB94700.1 Bgt-20150-3 [Blumeria graminis f. sp. tritici]